MATAITWRFADVDAGDSAPYGSPPARAPELAKPRSTGARARNAGRRRTTTIGGRHDRRQGSSHRTRLGAVAADLGGKA